ncbi:MAG: response regulator transcription factor, partial [Anaerolineae bacterium]|jgi:DNA-binding NarL/FixJ family response regulator|nr:response regulator transcription factor [Anaerolineae bacterium]
MAEDKIIRVLLADDHPTLRVGLRVLLDQAPDVEVVGEAEDGAEALTLIEALVPDVAVLDCQLPGMSGPQVAVEIKGRGLPTKVLALSSYSDDHYVRGMLEAGAVGYLLKSEAPEVIVAAVRTAVKGEGYFSSPVAAKIAAWARGELPAGLTKREMEVLRLVAEGLSNKEIAQALKVTAWTVGFHVSNILKKLGVESRVEAAVWAREHGIIS